MGLLDDAIRDHLELKRLRGADPGEVAREQREALEADPHGEVLAGDEAQATVVESLGAENEYQTIDVRDSPVVTPTSTADPIMAPEPTHTGDSSTGEETAELDMRSVLHEDRAVEDGSTAHAPEADPEEAASSFDDLNEDQLEWELPGAPHDAGQDDHALGGDAR